MRKSSKVHPFHYLTLILGLGLGFFLYLSFAHEPLIQFGIIFIVAIYYFVWGVVHHHVEGDLHLRVVLEYLMVTLVSIIAFSFLFNNVHLSYSYFWFLFTYKT